MKTIYVVGAIIVENGKILCAQRGNEKALANMWEFPGGKIESDETPREALIREIAEELLIKVEVNSEIFEETSYDYDFGRVHLTTFICLLKKGRPRLTEHHQIKWLAPSELNSIEWAPADNPVVKKIINEGVFV